LAEVAQQVDDPDDRSLVGESHDTRPAVVGAVAAHQHDLVAHTDRAHHGRASVDEFVEGCRTLVDGGHDNRDAREFGPRGGDEHANYRGQIDIGPEFGRLAAIGWSYRDRLARDDDVWNAVGRKPTTLSYAEEARVALADAEDTSYWFRHRNRAIARLAKRVGVQGALWDVGAGNGAVAAYLHRQGFDVVAVEPGTTGAAIAGGRGVETVIAGTLEELALPPASLRAVGLFDVIEHLEVPGQMLGEIARTLTPGGWLLVTVPAYSWLWSDADVHAGHYRRYNRRSLDREVLAHGFRRRTTKYLFHSLVPAVLLGRVARSGTRRHADECDSLERLIAELRPRNRVTRALAATVFAVEEAVDRIVLVPFGTSVLGAYERQPGGGSA
jgi:2-polyprenyl-3-methyl-5-hydroxy-6-metoxy-1,4-benzoquinol methylase